MDIRFRTTPYTDAEIKVNFHFIIIIITFHILLYAL